MNDPGRKCTHIPRRLGHRRGIIIGFFKKSSQLLAARRFFLVIRSVSFAIDRGPSTKSDLLPVFSFTTPYITLHLSYYLI